MPAIAPFAVHPPHVGEVATEIVVHNASLHHWEEHVADHLLKEQTPLRAQVVTRDRSRRGRQVRHNCRKTSSHTSCDLDDRLQLATHN
eukprot:3542587-Rhodomonas_salina.1